MGFFKQPSKQMSVENRRIFANMDEALCEALGLAVPTEVTPFLLRLADQRRAAPELKSRVSNSNLQIVIF